MGFLAPLMKEEKIRTFISDLPKSMSLASSIVEALVQPEMISVFEAGIPLSEILKEIDFQKMVIGDTGHSLPSSFSSSSLPSSPFSSLPSSPFSSLPSSSPFSSPSFSSSSGRSSSSGVTVTREEVPKIVQGIKEASQVAAPYLKILVHNFSSILNLEEDLNQLDLTGNGTDLLACKNTLFVRTLSKFFSFFPQFSLFLFSSLSLSLLESFYLAQFFLTPTFIHFLLSFHDFNVYFLL